MRPWTIPADRRDAGREISILLNLLLNGLSREEFARHHPFGWPPTHHAAYVVRHPRRKPGSRLAEFRERVLRRDFPGIKPRRLYRPGRPRKHEPYPGSPEEALKSARRILDGNPRPEDLL